MALTNNVDGLRAKRILTFQQSAITETIAFMKMHEPQVEYFHVTLQLVEGIEVSVRLRAVGINETLEEIEMYRTTKVEAAKMMAESLIALVNNISPKSCSTHYGIK